jgi:hypothetical protein
VRPWSLVVRWACFGGICYLYFQGIGRNKLHFPADRKLINCDDFKTTCFRKCINATEVGRRWRKSRHGEVINQGRSLRKPVAKTPKIICFGPVVLRDEANIKCRN